MQLEQLRSFAEVASTRHFTRAAERLHLSQPSLSRQISALEAGLGVELFHRARGNVTLTAAGERLLPFVKRMLADADAAQQEMAELAGLTGGHVRLGATPTLCTSLVAEVLTEFRARYPGIDIEILERGSRTLIETLMEGGLDIALIVTSVSSGAARAVLEHQAILEERLVVAYSADRWPLTAGEPVSLDRLAELPQIVFPKDYDLRIAVDAAFRARGLAPLVAVEGAEMDAALRFAELGIGAVVVPALVAVERPGLSVSPLADAQLTRTVSIARRADMAPTHAGAALRALITEVADRFAGGEAEFAALVRRVGAL